MVQMSIILVVFTVLLVIGIVALFVLLAKHHQGKMTAYWQNHHNAWSQIAIDLGLEYKHESSGHGMVEGPYQGIWVRIDTYTISNDNGSTTYTRVRSFHHPPLGLGLKVSREGMMSGLGKMVGLTHDIETGDTNFDNTFIVEGNDRDAIVQILNMDVRRHLMHYVSYSNSMDLDDQGISGVLQGRATHTSQLRPLVQAQVALLLEVRRAVTELKSTELQPEFAHSSISGSR